MNAIIISDLHLGSRYCRYERLLRFLKELPPDCDLILNGDTVDRWHKRLLWKHSGALDLLAAESLKRRVVWVTGNHDKRFVVKNRGKIEFKPSHSIGDRLFVSHGYNFDGVMPLAKAFIWMFRYMHHFRIYLGAERVHVAFYAKRFQRLYEVLKKNIRENAAQYAKEHGFKAVTCGHTHFVEDTVVDGIRYVNTGAWTEEPICYLVVNDTELKLERVGDAQAEEYPISRTQHPMFK